MDDRANLVLAECGRTSGSSQRVIWELVTRLPPARFAVQAWLPSASALDDLAAALAARDIEILRMPDVGSRWNLRGLARLWMRVRRTRPTLLHLHRADPGGDRLSAVLAEAAGTPRIVVTEHACAENGSAAHRAVRRRVFDRADAVTTSCGAIADQLVRDDTVDRALVRVIPNGAEIPDEDLEMDDARALRETLGAGPLRPLWICPTRLVPDKGHATLLEALAELARRGLLFTAGFMAEGPLRDSLALRVKGLGLAHSVHFIRPDVDLGAALLAADAVVIPSLREASPMALLAALVRGRPVVASAVGGMPELVEDGVTGILVPPGDVMALAQGLETFHRRPDLANRMGVHAARQVRDHFTWAHVVDAFEEVYDDVLGLATFEPAGSRFADARR